MNVASIAPAAIDAVAPPEVMFPRTVFVLNVGNASPEFKGIAVPSPYTWK
jgi:hypothetical protein